MHVPVIYCHPIAESFAAAAYTYVLQAPADGIHMVTDVDLYVDGFDPMMSRQERLDCQDITRNTRTVLKYDDQLAAAEATVLIYRAW
jgi:NAD(P)H dehydrogenase (quinone)